MQRKKIELLAPAGNYEKLETAIHFGADAVYVGGKAYSLRSHSANFTIEEIQRAVSFAHGHGVKVYVACNVFARNNERESLYAYLEQLARIGPDAVIVADPGIFMAAKKVLGDIDIHISTQANTTSLLSAQFWADQGASRINAARELSLPEIREIVSAAPVEVEVFVHGAMCVAMSGRCLLSHYLAGRDGNRGLCAHACRWTYHLVEEKRPGKYMPVYEDDRGSYFFSATDLCMIEHLPEMIESGISSLKIEGRMKGLNYIAATVKTYRRAIDAYYANPEKYRVDENWREELESVNYRGYSTGFYMNEPEGTIPVYDHARRSDDHRFIGKILETSTPEEIVVDIKNRIATGAVVEIIGRHGPARRHQITRITTPAEPDAPAAQPNTRAALALSEPDECVPGDIVRII
jgi:U32 family peptidase